MPITSADRQRAVAEPRAQRLALDERHRVERQAVRVARREHRDDVRVLQRGDRLDLALEPLDADALRELGRQHLHHDLALESRLLGHEDLRHAAAAEFALDGVAAAQGRLELVAQLSHGGRGWSRSQGAQARTGGRDNLARASRKPACRSARRST